MVGPQPHGFGCDGTPTPTFIGSVHIVKEQKQTFYHVNDADCLIWI